MITPKQLVFKRAFDLVLSVFLLPVLIVPIVLLIILSTLETKAFGIFVQQRVGQFGRPFQIYKIRTLNNEAHQLGHLEKDAMPMGRLIRRYKLDELPQLFNVILGQMSFYDPALYDSKLQLLHSNNQQSWPCYYLLNLTVIRKMHYLKKD